ncbi:MAG: NAD(P)H-hydrate epimerase [Candidatus Heimdallarchaeota archaeon]|nr:NAD(P)H-hydrate epimerase [Candidatus Heimdallarchaeota archaeon]
MIEVDRLMIEEYKISLIQMMENASYTLANLSRILYPKAKSFVIMVGKGNNGGGGLGAARRLHNWGYSSKVILASEENSLKDVPKRQLTILKNIDMEITSADVLEEIDLASSETVIIDALLGYSLKGNPRGNYAKLINSANESNLPIISLDIPSGIEGTKGIIYEPAIHAAATLTLALPKTAFLNKKTNPFLGELFVADISVPPKLYSDLGITYPKDLFQKEGIIKIDLN